jgi:hypothetical protein
VRREVKRFLYLIVLCLTVSKNVLIVNVFFFKTVRNDTFINCGFVLLIIRKSLNSRIPFLIN